MARSAHRTQLIKQYPSLINGDPTFRTSGHIHLGKRLTIIRPANISGLTAPRRRNKEGIKGTVIGFLSEADVDKSGNAAFVATKTSQYSREGEPSRLFHIALDEKDKDNDAVVVDLEEWELDKYCEWVVVDEKEKQMRRQVAKTSVGMTHTKTTEFERLNNLALEAAASVSNSKPATSEAAIQNIDNNKAPLVEGAASGCSKCQKELESGKKAKGPHARSCPRSGVWKSSGRKLGRGDESGADNTATNGSRTNEVNLGNNDGTDTQRTGEGSDRSGKSKDDTETRHGQKTFDASSSRGNVRKNSDKSERREKGKHANDTQLSKEADGSSSDYHENEGRPNQDHARALASASCPSFNEILKSALASYSTNTRSRNTNNPPPPIPPPFLSHEENCTLRTALAFVMARARNKGKINENMSSQNTKALNTVNHDARNASNDRLGGTIQANVLASHATPMIGGLLALPPRDCVSISELNLNASNANLALDRELRHVRDVMNLAVSTLLPLYKSCTLQMKSNERPGIDGQRQSAVYDYESAAKPFQGSHFELSASERHLASLDGLCMHIIGRLSSIMNDVVLRRQLANETPATEGKSDDGHSTFSVTEEGDAPRDEAKIDIVLNAVAQLQVDFMIDSFHNSSDPVQQIHQVMASCHVLHRLLLLDENHTTIGSDCVAMACTILTDLYNDRCIGGRNDATSNQLHQFESFRQADEQDGKEKHQVIPSRWSYTCPSYNDSREERRKQAVSVISQRYNSNGSSTGMKRSLNQSQDDTFAYEPIQLPRLGDVLAVNLLRLLEGASAIRLHFHKRYVRQSNGFMASKVAMAAAATEVLQEIRSKADHDLLMPIHINDAASVYYHEALKCQERHVGKVDHLLPGAKMMLRMHLFDLIQKLSMYEQG